LLDYANEKGRDEGITERGVSEWGEFSSNSQQTIPPNGQEKLLGQGGGEKGTGKSIALL